MDLSKFIFILSATSFMIGFFLTIFALINPQVFLQHPLNFSRARVLKHGVLLFLGNTSFLIASLGLVVQDKVEEGLIIFCIFFAISLIGFIPFVLGVSKDRNESNMFKDSINSFKSEFLEKNNVSKNASLMGGLGPGELGNVLAASGIGDFYIWETPGNLNMAMVCFDEKNLSSSTCVLVTLPQSKIVGYTLKGNRDVLTHVSGMDRPIFKTYADQQYTPVTTTHEIVDDRVTIFHYLDEKNEEKIQQFSLQTYDIFLELIPEKDITRANAAPVRPMEIPNGGDIAEKLEKLHSLKQSGAITEEEFQDLKRKLIEKG